MDRPLRRSKLAPERDAGDGAHVARLDHPLFTPRLRLEPVTPALAAAARAGQAAFADLIKAEAPQDWCAASLGLVARSAPAGMPTRAIAIHRFDGEVVGDVRFEALHRPGHPESEFEIGYGVARARRRQGYAVEAAGAVIDWLFTEIGAETIWAGCNADNVASVRTLSRLRFLLDSTPGRTFWWLLTPDLRSPPRA